MICAPLLWSAKKEIYWFQVTRYHFSKKSRQCRQSIPESLYPSKFGSIIRFSLTLQAFAMPLYFVKVEIFSHVLRINCHNKWRYSKQSANSSFVFRVIFLVLILTPCVVPSCDVSSLALTCRNKMAESNKVVSGSLPRENIISRKWGFIDVVI